MIFPVATPSRLRQRDTETVAISIAIGEVTSSVATSAGGDSDSSSIVSKSAIREARQVRKDEQGSAKMSKYAQGLARINKDGEGLARISMDQQG